VFDLNPPPIPNYESEKMGKKNQRGKQDGEKDHQEGNIQGGATHTPRSRFRGGATLDCPDPGIPGGHPDQNRRREENPQCAPRGLSIMIKIGEPFPGSASTHLVKGRGENQFRIGEKKGEEYRGLLASL